MKKYQSRAINTNQERKNSEKIELMLIDRGAVSYFNTTQGHFVLPFTSDGQIDIYGNLVSVRPVSYNGLQLTQLDTVPRILYDNSARQTFDIYQSIIRIS